MTCLWWKIYQVIMRQNLYVLVPLARGGQGERIYSPKGIAITLSAHGGGVLLRLGIFN